MTIIKLKGGLGNQLFQYAFGRLIVLRRREDLKLDKDILGQEGSRRSYGLDAFNIKAEIASREEVLKVKYPYGLISKALRFFKAKFLRIFHIGFEARMLKTKAQYLEGFFQSYKYLEPIRRELLEDLSLKNDNLKIKYPAILEEMKNSESVAVHIRRGDYVNNPKTKKAHFICDLNYYEKSFALIKDKLKEKNLEPKFFIFSDDINWAKDNLKEDNLVFVSRPEFLDLDYEELILMSRAKHNIIANSSFSFWSAWLNTNPEKIVIAPALWNRKYQRAYKDLLPEDWLRV